MRAVCPDCKTSNRDSVLICLTCDAIERQAVDALKADNERLHALVKAGEKGTAAYVACPWCEMEGGGHFESCPAFTPDGVVK